jgi:hypothetical protein
MFKLFLNVVLQIKKHVLQHLKIVGDWKETCWLQSNSYIDSLDFRIEEENIDEQLTFFS